MKLILAMLTILLSSTTSAQSAESDAVSRAQTAAKAWLALTDAAKYNQSCDTVSTLFKAAVPKGNCEEVLQTVRRKLGAVQSRRQQSANASRTLPGGPRGEYIIIRYDTVFGNKPAARETIALSHEKDGSWKVSGYFIK